MSNEHSPALAAIFSILLPGLGQFYNQEINKALYFFFGFMVLTIIYSPLGFLIVAIASIESFLKARKLRETGFLSKYQKIAIFVLTVFIVLVFLAGYFGSSIFKYFN